MPQQQEASAVPDIADTKYDAHLYALVRVAVCNISATSMIEAIAKAERDVDLNGLLGKQLLESDARPGIGVVEYAGRIQNAEVKVVGGAGRSRLPQSFHYANEWLPGKDPRVLISVQGGVAYHVADCGVQVEFFDHDDFESDPVGTRMVSSQFADLAESSGIPVDCFEKAVEQDSMSGLIS